MAAHPAGREVTCAPGSAPGGGLTLVVSRTPAPAEVSPLSVMRQACPERYRGGSPSAFAARTLPSEDQPVRQARSFTGSTLTGWGLEPLVEDVGTVATELVANALRHGCAGVPEPRVWVGLLRQGSTVLCAVYDAGNGVPRVKHPGDFAESGRGMQMVSALSTRWGWTAPGRWGKAVWAMFSV